MSKFLKSQRCITKVSVSSEHSLKNLHFDFKILVGECRIDVITFS